VSLNPLCPPLCTDVHAGNLLVLPDGRVGFIDFGIVGRISPVTWRAVEALLRAVSVGDFDTMARALATIGFTDTEVDMEVCVVGGGGGVAGGAHVWRGPDAAVLWICSKNAYLLN
jgi:hypothetical protein